MPDLLDGRGSGSPQQLCALGIQLLDLLCALLQALVFSEDALVQRQRQFRVIPQSDFFQFTEKAGLDLQHHALAGQQALDAVDVSRPFMLQCHPLPVQLALVFLFRAGNVHQAPYFVLALWIAQEHRE